jgi:hypothetical protein
MRADVPEEMQRAEEDHFYSTLQGLISEAKRRAEYASLAGDDVNVYTALRAALLWAVADLDILVRHVCQWDEDDVCLICGADGRA